MLTKESRPAGWPGRHVSPDEKARLLGRKGGISKKCYLEITLGVSNMKDRLERKKRLKERNSVPMQGDGLK